MTLNVRQFNNVLTYLFLAYVMLGPSPFFVQNIAENANVSGGQDIFRQVFLVLLFLSFVFLNKFRIYVSENILFVIFVGYSAISILWSDFPFHSIRRVILLFVVFMICLFIVRTQGDSIFRKLFNVLLCIQLINLFYFLFLPSYSFTELGFKGLHIQKNTLGVICIFSLFVSIALIKEVNRMLVIFLAGLSVFFLIISESKTNQGLALIVSIPILLSVISVDKAKKTIVTVFSFFITVFFIAGLFPNYLITNYASMIDHETLTGRGTIWLVLLDNIEDKPYFGFGYGGFWGVGEKSVVFLSEASWLDKIGEGHNGFLDLLVNLGVVGFFLYLAIITKSLKVFSSRINSSKNITLLSLYLYVFLHNFTESSLVNVVQMVWVLFIIMSMYFIRKEV